MTTAGQTTVTTVGTTVYNVSSKPDACTSYYVAVTDASSFGALINVAGLHDAGDYMYLGIGREIIFRHGNFGIYQVTVAGDGGDAAVSYGIVSRTYPSD